MAGDTRQFFAGYPIEIISEEGTRGEYVDQAIRGQGLHPSEPGEELNVEELLIPEVVEDRIGPLAVRKVIPGPVLIDIK